jgi:hypothetical protein
LTPGVRRREAPLDAIDASDDANVVKHADVDLRSAASSRRDAWDRETIESDTQVHAPTST